MSHPQDPNRIDALRTTTAETLICRGVLNHQHTWRGALSGRSFCAHCSTPEPAYRNAQDIALLLARIDELQATADSRGEELARWFDVHELVERAIDKDLASIDTYLLADALGREETTS